MRLIDLFLKFFLAFLPNILKKLAGDIPEPGLLTVKFVLVNF